MLIGFLKSWVGQSAAPFVAIALFVVIVGVSLILTPRIAGWIDTRKKKTPGFYDGMLEQPPESDEEL